MLLPDADNDNSLRRSWAGGISGFAGDGAIVRNIILNSVSINSVVLTRLGAISGEISRGCNFENIHINKAYISSVSDNFIGGIAGLIEGSSVRNLTIDRAGIDTYGNGNFVSGIANFALKSKMQDISIKTVFPSSDEAKERDNIISKYIFRDTSSLTNVKVGSYRSRHKSITEGVDVDVPVYKYIPYVKKKESGDENEMKNNEDSEQYVGTKKFQEWVNNSHGKDKILYGMDKFRDIKNVGKNTFEMRVHENPGYRGYFTYNENNRPVWLNGAQNKLKIEI